MDWPGLLDARQSIPKQLLFGEMSKKRSLMAVRESALKSTWRSAMLDRSTSVDWSSRAPSQRIINAQQRLKESHDRAKCKLQANHQTCSQQAFPRTLTHTHTTAQSLGKTSMPGSFLTSHLRIHPSWNNVSAPHRL
ncbi:hypothetical protein PoB_006066800 [Plakobranchus ocellatus]|uniref:Uncharacterized protein n=1 Tax=Plakobranchus ocellatus TaxID=259542 RepID=A0AAV4CQH9_9GAST|nr:hypothetical protein PoB_006066800 [Plakobranchus ocellatus]